MASPAIGVPDMIMDVRIRSFVTKISTIVCPECSCSTAVRIKDEPEIVQKNNIRDRMYI